MTTTTAILLPTPQKAFGPVTARRMGRAASVYLVIWVLGLLPTLLDAGPGWTATGASVALPGGGFLAAGHPWIAVVVLGAFVLSLVTWWFVGATVLPPIVWLGAAALAGAQADAVSDSGRLVALAAAPVLLALSVAVHVVRHRAQVRAGEAANARLATTDMTVGGPPDLDAGLPVVESSAEDLARLRYGLDLALQPLESFEGFTHLDQYREAALRYQLNALSYGLSMAQYTRTPAFTGYLAEAQRNAIEKMLQRKVWGYWARENLWGNLRWDPEPVENDENIMLTGYHGLMVGMYETLNDDRYSRPGGLPYRWSATRTYDHDLGTLAASIHRNMAGSDYALFPCEPNWVYTVCNTFGLNTLISHDRLHGTTYAADVHDHLVRGYETEFLRPDGKIVGVRARHLGLSWNFWASPSVQTTTAYWMHAGMPELSLRTWYLLRERLTIRDGQLQLPSFLTSGLDPGNYLMGRDTFGQIVTMMAAREVGDEEYALAAERTIDEREPVAEQDGARRLADSSGLANHYANLGRFGRRDGLRDLVAHGAPSAWLTGPVLAEAAYPEVLVARAVTDGHALDLVLLPGKGAVRTTLAVERLVPGRTYVVSGGLETSTIADDQGRALVGVDLGARLEVSLRPS
ncbi:linalool dehydratase/isomerase domain-containing protein [Aeromicrobium terrae]|uniref:Linalool dehydratase/isomerase domain-containing protein n=1 Tax=Aeromicrobium terrae TaxID=2498846 RepID=A0A5C8NGW5_9ACTN|nr:hypothetical protein [Aeromicrobium terrae]TXL57584.1 hypothetical protein FHP06_12385 [Aeromicrobium terrae]